MPPLRQDCLFHLDHHVFTAQCRWYKDAWMLSTRQRHGAPSERLYTFAYESAVLDALMLAVRTIRVPAPRSTEEP